VKLKEGPDLSVSPFHLLPLGSTPLEPDLETFWKDRLLIQVSNIVFIVLMVHNSLSTLRNQVEKYLGPCVMSD
jgi:hypothetical protein